MKSSPRRRRSARRTAGSIRPASPISTATAKPIIALVRQPHVIGSLELWSWSGGALRKVAELPDIANHIAGTRAIDMAATADFDGDGVADIAAPSLDRTRLRIVGFAPSPREIGSVAAAGKGGDQSRSGRTRQRSPRPLRSVSPMARWWWSAACPRPRDDSRTQRSSWLLAGAAGVSAPGTKLQLFSMAAARKSFS